MNTQLGEKIRTLRKSRNLSQEVLAQYLGISFQAVSKWEKGETLPDVMLIPAIASFFEISTDELFDYNRIETSKKVQKACWDIADYRKEQPKRAETELRKLLKQYPGNDIILTNLSYVLQSLEKNEELISLCKSLIAATDQEDIRYDTARILAETYRKMGEYSLCKETIDLIPEFFFTYLEVKALLLDGEDMFRPAWKQKDQSIDSFLWMSFRLSDYYLQNSDIRKAKHQLLQAKNVLLQLKFDEIPSSRKENYFSSDGQTWIRRIDDRLKQIADGNGDTICNTFDSYRRFY